jgi:hypothetical protein
VEAQRNECEVIKPAEERKQTITYDLEPSLMIGRVQMELVSKVSGTVSVSIIREWV